MTIRTAVVLPLAAAVLALGDVPQASGQAPAPPAFVSPEVAPGHRPTFRLWAPHANAVSLSAYDIPGMDRDRRMWRGHDGVWKLKLPPVEPGAYRYRFVVDGLTVVDPRNPATSQSNDTIWSLVYVPGSDLCDTREVPHGGVAEVTYYSAALGRFRRMHVYTPPGYERGEGRLPVLYLLHGAFDCDDAWTTVGRAGFILDNLIAAGRALPMIVVMPAGHTGPFPTLQADRQRRLEEFASDFAGDVRPYVETHYRVLTDAPHRALAGLSMGGSQALEIAIRNLPDYAYLGVFSSGVVAPPRAGQKPPEGPTWEQRHAAALSDPTLRQNLRLVWFAIGQDDFLLPASRATVAMLRLHGFEVAEHETEGTHRWVNWRRYLSELLPLLFREG